MCDLVVNVRNCNRSDYDVYIGRPSMWGNPYSIGVDGNRDEVIKRFREDLWLRINKGNLNNKVFDMVLVKELAGLKGKTLGCYCSPLPCHGDVLAAASVWADNYLTPF